MWHDIVPGKKDVWFDTTVNELENQFAEIKRRKFNVIPLDTLYDHLVTGSDRPRQVASHHLRRYDPRHIHVCVPTLEEVQVLGRSVHSIQTTSVFGPSRITAAWEQLKEMQDSGLVSIQSHTRTHPADLRKVSDEGLRKELGGSRKIIQEKIGHDPYAFAYTEGGHDERCARPSSRRATRSPSTSPGAARNRPKI
jgi:hypothetical protein